MYEISTDGLQQLLEEGRAAAAYAREHYEDFAARPHFYTLYGPSAHDIGASVPTKIVPPAARKLLKTTRRKNYFIYELDENYRPLRTVHMLDYVNPDCTFHHFELNGVHYAYPFRGRTGKLYSDKIYILKYAEGRPVYYGIASSNLLFAQFLEYPEADKMLVSTYRYFPTAKITMYGYPVDWNAPIGALNSPVDRHCQEECPLFLEFSKWFTE